MPQKPLLILDLDRVLFDTDAYLTALGESLQPFGVTKDAWNRSLRQATGPFRLREQADTVAAAIDADATELHQALERESADAVWFLHPDARPFLDDIREVAELHLLTRGDPDFQKLKLQQTGLERYFSGQTIAVEPKEEAKLPVSTVGQAVFISDDVSELLALGGRYRWSRHVHINREGRDVPPNFPFPSFASLGEAAPKIRELVGA